MTPRPTIVPDLLARAVKAGLVLAPCRACRGFTNDTIGRRVGYQNGYLQWCCAFAETDYEACPLCYGSGEDQTPGALRVAVETWWLGDAKAAFHPRIFLTQVAYLLVDHFREISEPHDGTPESIRDAALTAFCRAMEVTTCPT